jgi:SAM-dependent methyltransferase
MNSLYDDVDLYDLVAPRDADMERFYMEVAGGAGCRVLDLACGSGRFTVPLAASGADVTAIDISATMLARARQALADQGLSASLARLDMRDFDFDQRFDAILIAANSLLHLHSRDDFARAFAAIRRHLAPGGVFAFDIFVPSAAMLSRGPDQRQPMGTFAHARLGLVTVEETIGYDPTTQISRADWYWSTDKQKDFRHTRLDLRQIYPQELPLLLELGHLQLRERFGDFTRSPFAKESFRQVCVAVAA